MGNQRKFEIRRIAVWFIVCLFIFVLSTFLHECGHGFSNKLNGVSVSTGFNRVGNAYRFPGDADFRAGFEESQTFLLDFGVPVTLLLAIVFTVILRAKKEWKSPFVLAVAGFGLCNSVIRLVPCSISVISSLLTQTLHMEDEIQSGQLLAAKTGIGWLWILPVTVSIIISVTCLIMAARKCKNVERFRFQGMWTCFVMAYIISFFIENYLDGVIRINWIA